MTRIHKRGLDPIPYTSPQNWTGQGGAFYFAKGYDADFLTVIIDSE